MVRKKYFLFVCVLQATHHANAWIYKVKNEYPYDLIVKVNATGSKKEKKVPAGATVDFGKFGAMIGKKHGACLTEVQVKQPGQTKWKTLTIGGKAQIAIGSSALNVFVTAALATGTFCRNDTIILGRKAPSKVTAQAYNDNFYYLESYEKKSAKKKKKK